MRLRLQYHYVLASLFTLSLIAAAVLWVVQSRINEFRNHQIAIAEESARELAKEISRALAEKRRLASLFRDNEADLINRLTAQPDDDLREHLSERIKTYFPDSFAFTIADRKGELILDEFDGLVDGLCLHDIRDMAASGDYRVRIHPNNVRYHYDIMVPMRLSTGEGVFFVSFVPDSLGHIITAIEHLGHRLILASFDGDPLIEITADGGRDKLERDDYRLRKSELERVLATAPVPGSAWKALDLSVPGLFETHSRNIWRQAALVFAGFALTSLILMLGSVHVEQKRAEAGRALRAAKDELENRVKKRTRELYERNLQLQSEIAARRETEKENARLAAFPRENPNPILVCTPDGEVVYYNPAAAEAIHKLHESQVNALLPRNHREVLRQLDTDSAQFVEAGVNSHVYQYTYHSDEALGMVYVHMSDVTEKKRAEDKLKQSEQFFSQVTSVLAEGLMVLDSNSRLFFMNPEAERLLGWKQEDLSEHAVHDAIHQHDDRGVPIDQCRTQKALLDGSVERVDEEVFFHRSGRAIPVSYTAAPMMDGDAISGVVVAFQDITHRRQMEEKLRFMANHDALTGLKNRASLDQCFHKELQRSLRYHRPLAIFVVDLDHFKRVNDHHGHQAGDETLQSFAVTLRNAIRQSDVAGRFGGEEFVVVLPETSLEQAGQLAERLRETVETTPYSTDAKVTIRLTVSIGIAAYPDHGDTEKQLFAAADAAAYRAKEEGRNRVQVAS